MKHEGQYFIAEENHNFEFEFWRGFEFRICSSVAERIYMKQRSNDIHDVTTLLRRRYRKPGTPDGRTLHSVAAESQAHLMRNIASRSVERFIK